MPCRNSLNLNVLLIALFLYSHPGNAFSFSLICSSLSFAIFESSWMSSVATLSFLILIPRISIANDDALYPSRAPVVKVGAGASRRARTSQTHTRDTKKNGEQIRYRRSSQANRQDFGTADLRGRARRDSPLRRGD